MVGFAIYAHTNNTIYDQIAFFSSSVFFSSSFFSSLSRFFNKIIIEWQAMRCGIQSGLKSTEWLCTIRILLIWLRRVNWLYGWLARWRSMDDSRTYEKRKRSCMRNIMKLSIHSHTRTRTILLTIVENVCMRLCSDDLVASLFAAFRTDSFSLALSSPFAPSATCTQVRLMSFTYFGCKRVNHNLNDYTRINGNLL